MKLPKLQENEKAWCYMDSACGILKIAEDESGISEISFVHEKGRDQMEQSRYLPMAKEQLSEYFAGIRKSFDLPLSIHGTEFQKKVWKALCDIPYGETRSYGDIAKAIGSPKAQRAVGMANHANHIVIVIPCHRVISHDGKPGGYSYGVSYKQDLLDLERRYINEHDENSGDRRYPWQSQCAEKLSCRY